MTRIRTWPSRRLQVWIIVALVIGAGLTVFWQPLTAKGRAEKLYLDSWFVGTGNMFNMRDQNGRPDAAVRMLEKALKLAPGNSLYEQALVWRCPLKKLPDLLKRQRLGPKARVLAAARIENWSEMRIRDSSDARDALARLKAVEKADPTNSLVHYRLARALQVLGHADAALAEVRAGNRLGPGRFYSPELPLEVAEALNPASAVRPDFGVATDLRSLSMSLADTANDRLRHGKVGEACGILEQCVRMGMNCAASEPPSVTSVFVGVVVYQYGAGGLRPIYKDFGPKDRVQVLQKMDEAVNRARDAGWGQVREIDLGGRFALAFALPASLLTMWGLAGPLLCLAALSWTWAAIARKAKRQDALSVPPWSGGFIARISLATYALLLACVAVGCYARFDLVFADAFPERLLDLGPATIVLMCALQVIFIVLVLRVLHHRYDEHTGERTGIPRFIFRAPASAKAWTRKYVIAAIGGQLIFLACCMLLATIVYKPIFGGHPWESSRFRVGYASREEAAMRPVVADLRKASLGFDRE